MYHPHKFISIIKLSNFPIRKKIENNKNEIKKKINEFIFIIDIDFIYF